jgi:hypothetical protein
MYRKSKIILSVLISIFISVIISAAVMSGVGEKPIRLSVCRSLRWFLGMRILVTMSLQQRRNSSYSTHTNVSPWPGLISYMIHGLLERLGSSWCSYSQCGSSWSTLLKCAEQPLIGVWRTAFQSWWKATRFIFLRESSLRPLNKIHPTQPF